MSAFIWDLKAWTPEKGDSILTVDGRSYSVRALITAADLYEAEIAKSDVENEKLRRELDEMWARLKDAEDSVRQVQRDYDAVVKERDAAREAIRQAEDLLGHTPGNACPEMWTSEDLDKVDLAYVTLMEALNG